jgi:6-phosphogluconolactonase
MIGTGPEVVVVPDAMTGAARAAGMIAEALRGVAAERGRTDWATTGGSTPVAIYQAMLAPALRDAIPWPVVHTWWGDDRFVPGDHPLSNVRPFVDVLLDAGSWETVHSDDHRGRVRIPVGNLHPFRTGEALGVGQSAAACAAELVAELRDADLPETNGWPVFDLMLLGIGGDGHLLSVFPGSAAFDSTRWALAIPATTHIEPHVERVTLNPAVVGVARRVVVVTHGAGKAEIVGRIFGSERDPRVLPAQLALRDGATWILDEAAAARLPR